MRLNGLLEVGEHLRIDVVSLTTLGYIRGQQGSRNNLGKISEMPSLADRKKQVIAEMESLVGKDNRLKYVVDRGKELPAMAEKFKIDQFLVKGCISKAWLFPQLTGGHVRFFADSEAMVVKGLMAILLDVYNDGTPDEIVAEDGSFLADLGVSEHLSMNRRNGLANVLKLIHGYAAAFKAQA